jgi:hypothetical protein
MKRNLTYSLLVFALVALWVLSGFAFQVLINPAFDMSLVGFIFGSAIFAAVVCAGLFFAGFSFVRKKFFDGTAEVGYRPTAKFGAVACVLVAACLVGSFMQSYPIAKKEAEAAKVNAERKEAAAKALAEQQQKEQQRLAAMTPEQREAEVRAKAEKREAEIRERAEEAKKNAAAAEELQRIARIEARKVFAANLEKVFIEKRMNTDVTVEGSANTVLKIKWALASKVTANDLSKSGLIDQAKEAGFRRVIFTDGYNSVFEWDAK